MRNKPNKRNKPAAYAHRGLGWHDDEIYLTRKAEPRWHKSYAHTDEEWNESGWVPVKGAKPLGAFPKGYIYSFCLSGWKQAGMPALQPGQSIRVQAAVLPYRAKSTPTPTDIQPRRAGEHNESH